MEASVGAGSVLVRFQPRYFTAELACLRLPVAFATQTGAERTGRQRPQREPGSKDLISDHGWKSSGRLRPGDSGTSGNRRVFLCAPTAKPLVPACFAVQLQRLGSTILIAGFGQMSMRVEWPLENLGSMEATASVRAMALPCPISTHTPQPEHFT